MQEWDPELIPALFNEIETSLNWTSLIVVVYVWSCHLEDMINWNDNSLFSLIMDSTFILWTFKNATVMNTCTVYVYDVTKLIISQYTT